MRRCLLLDLRRSRLLEWVDVLRASALSLLGAKMNRFTGWIVAIGTTVACGTGGQGRVLPDDILGTAAVDTGAAWCIGQCDKSQVRDTSSLKTRGDVP
jgi:hypothetical protein